MKNIVIFLLFLSTVFIARPVFAKTDVVAEPTEKVVQKVEYVLPYPGILPDHPLFFLKKFRDQIMEKLIADPMRKVEFYVLQADKYMNMGVFLGVQQKEALAQETMKVGIDRMRMAVQTAIALKSEGKEVPPYIVEKFTNALGKYSEISQSYAGVMSEITKVQEDVVKLTN